MFLNLMLNVLDVLLKNKAHLKADLYRGLLAILIMLNKSLLQPFVLNVPIKFHYNC